MNFIRRKKLGLAILELEYLIENSIREENVYQNYFERNDIVFTVLGYEHVYAFTKAGKYFLDKDEYTGLRPEPDFITQRPNKLYEIFEIKTPFYKDLLITSNKYRERFRSEIVSYIEQTITYEEYFTNNPANRKALKSKYGFDIQEKIDIKLVVGLDKFIDKKEVHKKVRNYAFKIDIITYDEIMKSLISRYDAEFGVYENIEGLTFSFYVRFHNQHPERNQYFMDFGTDKDRNRVSIYINQQSELCFELIDDIKKIHRISLDTDEHHVHNKWHFIQFEIGKIENSISMFVSMDGIEKGHSIKEAKLNEQLEIHSSLLGTDIEQVHFGRFDLAHLIINNITLKVKDRIGMIGYMERKYKDEPPNHVSFDGEKQFMTSRNFKLTLK